MTGDEFIPIAETFLCGNEKKYVLEAVESGWVSSIGPFVKRFEESFAKHVGTRFAATVSNGTTALHLAYLACGVGHGDEVIVPDLTFVATANAAAFIGAKPVLVDVDEKTWNMDPRHIEERITSKTKAIVPVHLYGVPCDMAPILAIAKKHGLKVIEDCAEAQGATYGGKKVGSLGDCAAFSFFGNKIITTGEGGMVTTDDPAIFERVQFLKSHAMSPTRRYYHPEIGFNYRLTALQAAFGLGQLEGVETILAHKRRIAERYVRGLEGVRGIRFQADQANGSRVHWLFNICVEKEFGISRDELGKKLREKNIDTRPVFFPLSKLPMYVEGRPNPVASRLSECGLSLPTGTGLLDEQVDRVVAAIVG